MSTKTTKNKQDAGAILDGMLGPLTLGRAIWSYRMTEELTQVELAEKLGVGKAYLCDVEKGRRLLKPEMAARWARKLQDSEAQFVRLALQDELREANLAYEVHLEAAHA